MFEVGLDAKCSLLAFVAHRLPSILKSGPLPTSVSVRLAPNRSILDPIYTSARPANFHYSKSIQRSSVASDVSPNVTVSDYSLFLCFKEGTMVNLLPERETSSAS